MVNLWFYILNISPSLQPPDDLIHDAFWFFFQFRQGRQDVFHIPQFYGLVEVFSKADFIADFGLVFVYIGIGRIGQDFFLDEGMDTAFILEWDIFCIPQFRVRFPGDFFRFWAVSVI